MNNDKNNFFVIISPPRCMSTYLRGLIDSHPDVICHNEIFHQDGTSLFLRQSDKNHYLFDTAWRDTYPSLFVEQMLAETSNQFPQAKWIGCKILLTHSQMHHLDALLKLKPRVIILTRNNKLAWYSSMKISLETHVWVTYKYKISQHKVFFDAKEFKEWNQAQTQFEKDARLKLAEYHIDYMELDYDELAENSSTKRILTFLNLADRKLSAKTVEQNSIHVLKRFHNPEDVAAFVASINQTQWLIAKPKPLLSRIKSFILSFRASRIIAPLRRLVHLWRTRTQRST